MMQRGKLTSIPALVAGLFGLLLALSACEKPEERMLGKEAISEEERLNSKVQDTFSIEVRSVTMPSVPAIQSSPAIFGKLKDDRTGTSRGAFYSQLLLPGSNIDMGDPNDLVLDSAVLSLRYAGYYGDTTTVQDFRVHQVVETMKGIDPSHRDSLHRSNTPIGSVQKAPEIRTSVSVNGGSTTLPPQLRIKLKDSFGENILDRSGEQELSDNDAFTEFVQGICISSYTSLQNGEGAMVHVEVPHKDSKVTLYYRNTAQSDTGTLELDLGSSYFNRFVHDPSGSDMASELGSTFSDNIQKSYVLAPGEVATQLRFPTLEKLDDSGNVSVNKALLDLSVEDPNGLVFPPASGLHVLYRNASGELSLTKDRTQEGGQFIGGGYEAKQKRYRFRITRHIQAILNGNVGSKSIYVTTSIPFLDEGEANSSARSVLKGPGSSDPPRLEITYTEY